MELRTDESEIERWMRMEDDRSIGEAIARDELFTQALRDYQRSPTYMRSRKKHRNNGLVIIKALDRLVQEKDGQKEIDPRVVDLREEDFVPRPELLTEFLNWKGQKERRKTTEFDRLISSLLQDKVIEERILYGVKTKRSREGKQKPSTFYRLYPGAEPIGDEEWQRMNPRKDTVYDLLLKADFVFRKEALLHLGVQESDLNKRALQYLDHQEPDDHFLETCKDYNFCAYIADLMLRERAGDRYDEMWDHIDKRVGEIFGRRILDIRRARLFANPGSKEFEEGRILDRPWAGA